MSMIVEGTIKVLLHSAVQVPSCFFNVHSLFTLGLFRPENRPRTFTMVFPFLIIYAECLSQHILSVPFSISCNM